MVTSIRPITAKPKPVKAVKTRKPRRGKTSRQLLVKALDLLTREIVLLRDGFCVCPAPTNGHSRVRQAGHLITRGKVAVRWNLYNQSEQCSSCNLLHEHQPERYTKWFIDKFGLETYKSLCHDSEEVCKMSVDELMELRTQLTEILSRQREDKTFKPYFTQKEVLTGEWRNNAVQKG
jgi:hypothetical protein